MARIGYFPPRRLIYTAGVIPTVTHWVKIELSVFFRLVFRHAILSTDLSTWDLLTPIIPGPCFHFYRLGKGKSCDLPSPAEGLCLPKMVAKNNRLSAFPSTPKIVQTESAFVRESKAPDRKAWRGGRKHSAGRSMRRNQAGASPNAWRSRLRLFRPTCGRRIVRDHSLGTNRQS